MPAIPPKAPTRFVPTLTEVVHEDQQAHAPRAATALAGTGAAHAHPNAARPAPAATRPSTAPAAQRAPAPAQPIVAQSAGAAPSGLEEHVIHRIMQRVDLVLDQRMRAAIATVLQEQTRTLVPRLREEVESVVRHAVYEAVADELSGTQPRAD